MLRLFLLLLACVAASAADISGKITLNGTPPKEKPIQFDDICAPMPHAVYTSRNYMMSKDHGLPNVFVYISKGMEGKTFPTPTTPLEINQEGCMYYPVVAGAMVGQTVSFKNSDQIMHNVHGVPLANGNTEFNFAEPTQGMVNDTAFVQKVTKPEVLIRVNCDIHKWMTCYIGVLTHPFFAVSDKDGKFTIKDVPPGKYTLTAYHVKTAGSGPGKSVEITVTGAPVKADFTIELPAPK